MSLLIYEIFSLIQSKEEPTNISNTTHITSLIMGILYQKLKIKK